MAHDIIKPAGATKASQNDAGGGVIRSEPVIGTVKNNIDPIRAGRVQVYIQDMNGYDPDDSKNWITVRYLSPFYGRTYGQSPSSGFGNYPNNPISYGEWHSPPDIGTQVICIFVNGDMNYGYYIGCIPDPEALTMVPAIGSVKSKVILNEGEAKSLAGATQLPVTNINTANENMSNSSDFLNAPKPVHSYVSSVLAQQGLIRDTVRGTITTSSQRETPSRVGWGVSSPGRPIYEGGYTDATVTDALQGEGKNLKIISRRAGHSIVMDDGDLLGKDQLIRLRTSLGHQILMSDDGQCLFIIHANGQSWIELGKEGTIDMYATNSVNIRTQGDLNLHADNDVNIQANNNINIKAKENISIDADSDVSLKVGGDFTQQTSGDHALKVDGAMSMLSNGESSYASGSTTYINGSVVNLNTGSASLTPEEVKQLTMFTHTDTLFDNEKGFAPAPGKLETIASRAPAHHPWVNAGQGVDVTTELGADAELPESPSEEVEQTNNEVPSTPETPVTPSIVATVPGAESASASLGVGTTSALVSSTALSAATNAASAVSSGSAIIGGQALVGQLGQTAQQLVTGGTLKPGADTLINGLVKSGASVTGAMTSNMFTGKSGSGNLQSFVQNTGAQVSNMVTNIAASEKQLIQSGVISGKQSPVSTAGLILSGVQNGVQQTVDFVKNIGSGVAGGIGKLGAAAGNIANSISSGNFAGALTSGGGLLSGLTGTLGGLVDKAKGAASAAFASITGAYKSFKANVPQDLTAIAKSDTAETRQEENVDPYAGLTPQQIETIGDADASDPFIRSRLGLPSLTASSGSSLIDNNVATSIAGVKNLDIAKTGLQGLPGGQGALSLVVNNAKNAVNSIPGSGALGSLINTNASSLLNGVSPSTMSAASVVGKALGGAGLPAGGLSGLTSGASGILDGIKSQSGSLMSTASSILPKGLASQLNSAVNAIASENPEKLKVPIVAENTVNRGPLDSQVSSIIDNPKIPPPTYGDIQTQIQTEQESLEVYNQKLKEQRARFNAQLAITKQAKQQYEDAAHRLPPGDPTIAELKTKFEEEYKKVLDITAELA